MKIIPKSKLKEEKKDNEPPLNNLKRKLSDSPSKDKELDISKPKKKVKKDPTPSILLNQKKSSGILIGDYSSDSD